MNLVNKNMIFIKIIFCLKLSLLLVLANPNVLLNEIDTEMEKIEVKNFGTGDFDLSTLQYTIATYDNGLKTADQFTLSGTLSSGSIKAISINSVKDKTTVVYINFGKYGIIICEK